MKALMMPSARTIELVDMDKPVISEGRAIVHMVSCGICGSDLTAYQGNNPTVRYPIHGIGHEGVGIIEAIDSQNSGLKVGDRVALEPYISCGVCHSCLSGRFNNCERLQVAGVHTSGMMMEYCSHPVRLLHKLPDSLEFHRAALVEPLTIGLHGVHRGQVHAGDLCVVTGAGPIGLLAAFGVLSKGGVPVLVDVLQKRLDFARSLGIPYIYNNLDGNLPAYLRKIGEGRLADVLVECTGSPQMLAQVHDYVRHGARIALVGWPKTPVEINTVRCMQKELDIYTSRNSNGKFPEAIHLIDTGFVPVEAMISRIVQLEEVESTMKDMIANPCDYIKVVVDID